MFVIAAAVTPWQGGCASNKDQGDDAKSASRQAAAPDPFDAGANAPPSANTLYALSKILAAQERYTESIAVLRNLLAGQPNYIPAYNAIAEVQLRTGQMNQAVETLSIALKRAPEDPVLLNNLGMSWFLQERYDEALPYFEKAVDVRPEVAMYRANQAATLGMLGRNREANAAYRRIMNPAAADENIDILNKARRKAVQARRDGSAGLGASDSAVAADASPPTAEASAEKTP